MFQAINVIARIHIYLGANDFAYKCIQELVRIKGDESSVVMKSTAIQIKTHTLYL